MLRPTVDSNASSLISYIQYITICPHFSFIDTLIKPLPLVAPILFAKICCGCRGRQLFWKAWLWQDTLNAILFLPYFIAFLWRFKMVRSHFEHMDPSSSCPPFTKKEETNVGYWEMLRYLQFRRDYRTSFPMVPNFYQLKSYFNFEDIWEKVGVYFLLCSLYFTIYFAQYLKISLAEWHKVPFVVMHVSHLHDKRLTMNRHRPFSSPSPEQRIVLPSATSSCHTKSHQPVIIYTSYKFKG